VCFGSGVCLLLTSPFASCDLPIQKLVNSLTYEQLITTQDGIAVSRALVNVVINQQIGQQISVSSIELPVVLNYNMSVSQVDTISEVLQQRCGSFCSTDDVLLYKVSKCFVLNS
jgi:nuclear pore complex protein Nup155